ncbi:taperin [Lacerta agilis]|uniref:taperin n=1 Tax=Lacerta agilis TaxID=80427 RepID=UPI0014199FE8|nr:taperin [Lacerta agilis]
MELRNRKNGRNPRAAHDLSESGREEPLPRMLMAAPPAQGPTAQLMPWQPQATNQRRTLPFPPSKGSHSAISQSSPLLTTETARPPSVNVGTRTTRPANRRLSYLRVLAPCSQSRSEAAAMDSSTLPEWKKALLERKRAKRAAEAARLPSGDGFSPLRRRPAAASLSRLLELYSTMPGVRTIRADRIVIIETCPGEAAKPRVQGAAELRAEQVVVYEPEPGHVRRLRHQFDPGRAGGATRMRRCGACGRKEASGCALRMSEGASSRFGGTSCACPKGKGALRIARCACAKGGVTFRYGCQRSQWTPLVASAKRRRRVPQCACQSGSRTLRLGCPRGKGGFEQRTAHAWRPVGRLSSQPENTWPASPDARVPKESAWTTSERRATNHEDAGRQEGARPASPKGPERRATDSEESGWTSLEPYYGSQGRPCSVSPRGWELHTTNPKKTPSLRDATDPKGRLRGTIATRAVAAPGTDAALSPSASLRRNSHNSFQVVPRPRGAQVPRWAPAPQEPDRVPVTCIDEDATGSLPPLKVLSPRLEGCDVSDDSPLALDSEDATLGPGFESSLLLQNGSREAPGADFEGALPRGRYPRADEIEVIGGYLSLDRSCMSKAGARRRKKLKISFDDSRLHTMFEYPSENSLVAEEQEEEVEGEEEEEEYASEVDEAPPLPSAKRAAPSCRPNSGFSSYTPKLHSEEGGRFKEAPPKLGTVVPGADSPDNHVMLTPAGAGALSDFSSEPALYF